MSESKQQQLAQQLAAVVRAEMAADIKETHKTLAQMTVTMNAILARIEIIDSCLKGGAPVAPKRSVRTGAAKKDGAPAGADGGAKGTAKADPTGKVTNALLFFRYAMSTDFEGFRDEYAGDDLLAEAAADTAVAKVSREKDEGKYFATVGAYLWSKVLTDDQKAAVRTRFLAWKEERARNDAPPPLEEDADAA